MNSARKRPYRKLPKYCSEETDKRDTSYIYFRRPGMNKVRLHGSPWSPDFMAQYTDAMKAYAALSKSSPAPMLVPVKHGTWRWLCEGYLTAKADCLAKGTHDTRRRILRSTYEEPVNPKRPDQGVYGDVPISKMMEKKPFKVLRDRKGPTGTAGNDRRKVCGYVLAWGGEEYEDLVTRNPVREVLRIKHVSKNFKPLRPDHFYLLMEKYPAGSKVRRAMALHLFTGARGCDVRQLGPQHIQNGRVVFTQQKTGGEVDIPLLEDLAAELALAPKDSLAFILTEYGGTFTGKGYNNWINRKIREAGITDRTSHGMRSGAATIAADNGADLQDMMGFFGWCSEAMALRYIREANKRKQADRVGKLIRLEQMVG